MIKTCDRLFKKSDRIIPDPPPNLLNYPLGHIRLRGSKSRAYPSQSSQSCIDPREQWQPHIKITGVLTAHLPQ